MANELELERLIIRILGESDDFEKAVQRVIKDSDRLAAEVSGDTKKIEKGFDDIGKRLQTLADFEFLRFARVATRTLKTIGSDLVGSASDLEESINAVQVTFGRASETILQFGKDAALSAGLSGREVNELATTTGTLLMNLAGLSQQDAAEEFTRLAQRAADMASVFNKDVSEAMVAIEAALRGETEPIRRFGVSVDAAQVKIKAMEMGLASSAKELTRHQKTLAALELIYEQTNQVAGDFVNTADSLANATRIQRAQIASLKAQLGQELIPIMQDFLSITAEIVKWFTSLDKQTQSLIVRIGFWTGVFAGSTVAIAAVIKAIGLLVSAFGPLIKRLIATHALGGPKAWAMMAAGIAIAIAAVATLEAVADKEAKQLDDTAEAAENLVKKTQVAADATRDLADQSLEATNNLNKQKAAVFALGNQYSILGHEINKATMDLLQFLPPEAEGLNIFGGTVTGSTGLGFSTPALSGLEDLVGPLSTELDDAERRVRAIRQLLWEQDFQIYDVINAAGNQGAMTFLTAIDTGIHKQRALQLVEEDWLRRRDSLADSLEEVRQQIQEETGAIIKQIEAKQELARLDKMLTEEGEKLTKSLRTPLEKARDELENINNLVQRGKINWDTYGRAVEKVFSGLKRDKVDPKEFFIGSAVQGSQRDIALRAEAQARADDKKMEDLATRHLRVDTESRDLLRELVLTPPETKSADVVIIR